MAISGSIQASFDVRDSQTVGVASVTYAPKITHSITFTDGAGAKKAKALGSAAVVIGSSPTELDLSGTDLKDLNGNGLAFTKIKALMLSTPATNETDVIVGADDVAPWAGLLGATGTLTLPPGSSVLVATEDADGWAVAAGTGDILQVDGDPDDVLHLSIAGEVGGA